MGGGEVEEEEEVEIVGGALASFLLGVFIALEKREGGPREDLRTKGIVSAPSGTYKKIGLGDEWSEPLTQIPFSP